MLKMCGNVNRMFTAKTQHIVLIGLLMIFASHVESISSQLPCQFHDSVNITDGTLLPNKTIVFDSFEFPQNQYAELDYIWSGDEKISTPLHLRGCLCNRKPCIRLCCPLGSMPEIKNKTRVCTPHEGANDLKLEILDRNNASTSTKIDQHFSIVHTKSCEKLYFADDYKITHVNI